MGYSAKDLRQAFKSNIVKKNTFHIFSLWCIQKIFLNYSAGTQTRQALMIASDFFDAIFRQFIQAVNYENPIISLWSGQGPSNTPSCIIGILPSLQVNLSWTANGWAICQWKKNIRNHSWQF